MQADTVCKKKGMVCIVTLMLALSFGGCGDKEKKADTTAVTKENETTTVSQEGTGQSESEIDFSQVYDNIELNGKKIPFPFTLNDLGEEYDFKWDVVDMGDGLYGADLAYKDEILASVYMYGKTLDSINRESEIVSIVIYDNREQLFLINGINYNSNLSDVEQIFPNMSKEYNRYYKNEIHGYNASDKNGKYFDIAIDNNEITIITYVIAK